MYLQKEKDLKSTISAIDEAIKALEEASTTTDAKLLLSQHRQELIRTFLQSLPVDPTYSRP